MGNCRICGAPHKSCGPRATVVPVDSNFTRSEITVGLKRYEVLVEGRHPHTTVLQLSDEDAKRLGVLGNEVKPKQKSRRPSNKSRTPANKASAAAPEDE